MKKTVAVLLTVLFLCAGCAQKLDGDGMERSYTQISQETAAEMMAKDDGHVVVDVRRQDEYDAGHIPGAILIPNESIGTERPAELPDPDQIILIYCRSGNRSKEAAEKLFRMGYTNVYEFGGINEWKGEVVTEETGDFVIWTAAEDPVSVRYDRYWMYGVSAEIDDPELVAAIADAVKALTVGEQVDYVVDDFTDILTFTFADGSTLQLEFEEQNWVKDRESRYHVDGLSYLRGILDEALQGMV